MVMLEWWQQPVNFSTVPVMLTLKQPLPWPSKLHLKREIAELEAKGLSDEADQSERALLAEAKRAYFDLALAERDLAVNARVRTLLENLVQISDAQYRVGTTVQADLLGAQMELLETDNQGFELERDRREAIARLNGLLDRPAAAPLGPTATAPAMVILPLRAELLARSLANRPAVQRAQSMLSIAEARLDLTQREDYPELSVWGAFMLNFGGVDAFTAGLSTTLPIFSGVRKRALTQASNIDREAALLALDALRRQTDVEVETAVLQLEAAAQHVKLHAEKLIPLADLTLQSAEAAYQSGKVPFITVLEAARAVRTHHLDHIKYLVEYERRLADLEEITGEDLLTEAH